MMFLIACTQSSGEAQQADPQPDGLPRNEIRHVEVCTVLEEPSEQDRLYFLSKVNRSGVDAQAELTQGRDPLLRCAEVQLALLPGEDGIRVDMDWMPRGGPVAIHEMRIYKRAPHLENDPYAVARYEPAPFQDYVFFVNLMTPALYDASTIYLPPTL